jgi:hypothetical protein
MLSRRRHAYGFVAESQLLIVIFRACTTHITETTGLTALDRDLSTGEIPARGRYHSGIKFSPFKAHAI